MSPEKDCLFCKIAEKKIPSDITYETPDILAFSDIKPQAPFHVLIIPKKHIATLADLKETDTGLAAKMIEAANKIAKTKGIDKSGYRIVFNCNKDAGQLVFHLHMHLLGGRPMGWPPG